MSDFSVGIDFGTTNSCVSIIYNDQIIVVPNITGDFITPSIVNLDENNNYSVGYSAKYKMIKDAEHTKKFIVLNQFLISFYQRI